MESSGIKGSATRRRFLTAGAASLAGSLLLPNRTAVGQPTRKPNVLIVMSDQETEFARRQPLNIPNRIALERNGVHFAQAICTAPQCSPSRASIMTGLYPHQAGVVTNVDRSSLGRPLAADVKTIGHHFSEHGYSTGYRGKWHLGNKSADYGFTDFGGAREQSLEGDALAEEASSWIKRQSSKPWLLVASFTNPHNIYDITRVMADMRIRPGITLPDNFNDDLEHKPEAQKQYVQQEQGHLSSKWGKDEWLKYRSFYLDLIEKVDRNLGKLVDTIRTSGQAEDTIVIYTSDHGDMNGSHRLPFKGPFMYDELLRVPLTISYPRLFQTPVVINSPVSSIDLLPTLASLANIEVPSGIAGEDLSMLFKDPTRSIHSATYTEYDSKQHFVNPIRTIRTEQWKYNCYVAPGQVIAEELYQLDETQGELVNLVKNPAYREVYVGLRNDLQQWREGTKDPLI